LVIRGFPLKDFTWMHRKSPWFALNHALSVFAKHFHGDSWNPVAVFWDFLVDFQGIMY
jgi:hypothetical protein